MTLGLLPNLGYCKQSCDEYWGACKTTMRYHFISVRMAIIKKPTSNKCQRGRREKGTLAPCQWGVNSAAALENSREGPQKIKNRVTI